MLRPPMLDVDSVIAASSWLASLPYPKIDPVAFTIPGIGFGVRWYALAYIAGLFIGWQLVVRMSREENSPFNEDQAQEFPTWVLFGLMLGGRFGYVFFYKPGYYLENPGEMLAVWNGGMSFHGGLLGIFLAIVLFCRVRKVPLGAMTDATVLVAPLGLLFGRLANFINGELYGRPTEHWIGMVFPDDPLQTPRHPSQLYEALLEGLCLFISLWVLRPFVKDKYRHGFLSGAFLVGYGLFRSTAEIFRQPDAHLGFIFSNVTMGQILSFPMILAGIVVMWQVARLGPPEPPAAKSDESDESKDDAAADDDKGNEASPEA